MTPTDKMREALDSVHNVIGLFQSAIKCGEQWTPECQRARDQAVVALKDIREALAAAPQPGTQPAPALDPYTVEQCAKAAEDNGDLIGIHSDRIARAIRALLPAPPQPQASEAVSVPEGWQLVPKVADETMLSAGNEASLDTSVLMDDTRFACERAYWKAMLAAAPPPPSPVKADPGCKNKGGTCLCMKYCADAIPGTRVKEPSPPSQEGKS